VRCHFPNSHFELFIVVIVVVMLVLNAGPKDLVRVRVRVSPLGQSEAQSRRAVAT